MEPKKTLQGIGIIFGKSNDLTIAITKWTGQCKKLP